jgi:hypothetical protein
MQIRKMTLIAPGANIHVLIHRRVVTTHLTFPGSTKPRPPRSGRARTARDIEGIEDKAGSPSNTGSTTMNKPDVERVR